MKVKQMLLPALAVLLLTSRLAPPLLAQGLSDVLGKKSGSPSASQSSADASARIGKDRVDLSLSPSFASIGSAERRTLNLGARADLGMVCGKYDFKASYQSMMTKEAREEFLEGIQQMLIQELIGSGMELLCQAEPTICTLLQNYSATANMKVSYYKDLCQAVEAAVADAGRKNSATSVDQCLKDKQAQGVPIDIAVESCQNRPPEVRNFGGQVVAQLDLGKELGFYLRGMNLSPGGAALARTLTDDAVIGPTSATSKADPQAVPQYFDEKRRDYEARLSSALDEAASGQGPRAYEVRALTPPGAPPLALDELQELSLLPRDQRAAVVGSMASAMALYEMGAEIHEVERALEVIKSAPTVDEANRKLLEDRLQRLRGEKIRLTERLKDQGLVLESYAAARALSAREYGRRVASVQVRAGEKERVKELERTTSAYGSLPPLPQSAQARSGRLAGAQDCGGCGLELRMGTYGK